MRQSGFAHRCLSSVLSVLSVNRCFIYSNSHHWKLFFFSQNILVNSQNHAFSSLAHPVQKLLMLCNTECSLKEEKISFVLIWGNRDEEFSFKPVKLAFSSSTLCLRTMEWDVCEDFAHGVSIETFIAQIYKNCRRTSACAGITWMGLWPREGPLTKLQCTGTHFHWLCHWG